MKYKIKLIIVLVSIFITSYLIIFSVDILRVKELKEPIFCVKDGHMGSLIKYNGLGYKIGLEFDADTGKITYGQMSIARYIIIKESNE